MNRNVGGIDRGLRVFAGLALLSLLAILGEPARWWGLVGLVPIATAIFGWCPLYTLLGVDTCRAKPLS